MDFLGHFLVKGKKLSYFSQKPWVLGDGSIVIEW
jgi:hypothetical protein